MMAARTWDDLLDEIEEVLGIVEAALARGEPVPDLPAFEAPEVMPRLDELQRARAEALMRRQDEMSQRVAAEIITTRSDIAQLGRRRTAARAYARGG